MRLVIDVDGTLSALLPKILERLQSEGGPILDPCEIGNYNYGEAFGRKWAARIHTWLEDPAFFRDLPTQKGPRWVG